MKKDQCIEIARQAAVACAERHAYMPPTELLAEVWEPHRWVIDAMQCAATIAEGERDRYRAGNTELLELWMRLIEGEDIIDTNERVREILEGAGLLENGTLLWSALEARKPKPQTWEQAVRECITDPAEVERLLALADDASPEQVHEAVTGKPPVEQKEPTE